MSDPDRRRNWRHAWPLRYLQSTGRGDPPSKWMFIVLGWISLVLAALTVAYGGSLFNAWSLGAVALLFMRAPGVLRTNYRSGWFAARNAMWNSLNEAHERHFDLDQWVEGERERDVADLMRWTVGP